MQCNNFSEGNPVVYIVVDYKNMLNEFSFLLLIFRLFKIYLANVY